MKKAAVFVVLLLALVLSMTGCSKGGDGGKAEKVIRIGGALPLSGATAYWGSCTLQAFQAGAADINERGGVRVGKDRYKIEIVYYDSKGTIEDAKAATTRLVERDKVKYVFTNTGSSIYGVLQVTEPAKVLCLSATWGNLQYFGPEFPLHFNFEMTDYEQGYGYIPFMLDYYGKDKLKTCAFIGPDDQDGYDCYANYLKLLQHFGMKDLGHEYFNWEDTDFYPITTKIIKNKPDFIITSPTPPGITASIVKAAREMGYTGPISSPGALETATILQIAGDFADKVILPGTVEQDLSPSQQAMADRLKKMFGEYRALSGLLSWWVYAFAQAVEVAGTLDDTQAIANALEKVQLKDTFVGNTKFAGTSKFGLPRQGIYMTFCTILEKGKARVADRRYPELPENY